jgi:hypothetical protein
MKTKIFGGATALALLALVGCAQQQGGAPTAQQPGTGEQQAYTLRLQANQGEQFSYNITVEMDMDLSGVEGIEQQPEAQGEHRGTINARMNLVVKDVQEDRITFFREIVEPRVEGTGLFQLGGDAMAQQFVTSGEIVVNSRYRVLEGEEAEGASFFPEYPEQAVRVGDTWQSTVQQDGQEQQVTGRLVGVENVGGVDLLRIEFEGIRMSQFASEGPVVFWVNPQNGRVHRQTGRFSGTEQGVRMTMQTEVAIAEGAPAEGQPATNVPGR